MDDVLGLYPWMFSIGDIIALFPIGYADREKSVTYHSEKFDLVVSKLVTFHYRAVHLVEDSMLLTLLLELSFTIRS